MRNLYLIDPQRTVTRCAKNLFSASAEAGLPRRCARAPRLRGEREFFWKVDEHLRQLLSRLPMSANENTPDRRSRFQQRSEQTAQNLDSASPARGAKGAGTPPRAPRTPPSGGNTNPSHVPRSCNVDSEDENRSHSDMAPAAQQRSANAMAAETHGRESDTAPDTGHSVTDRPSSRAQSKSALSSMVQWMAQASSAQQRRTFALITVLSCPASHTSQDVKLSTHTRMLPVSLCIASAMPELCGSRLRGSASRSRRETVWPCAALLAQATAALHVGRSPASREELMADTPSIYGELPEPMLARPPQEWPQPPYARPVPMNALYQPVSSVLSISSTSYVTAPSVTSTETCLDTGHTAAEGGKCDLRDGVNAIHARFQLHRRTPDGPSYREFRKQAKQERTRCYFLHPPSDEAATAGSGYLPP